MTTSASVVQLLTPQETADRLRLSIGTVRRLEKSGQLSGFRLAGRLRFSATAINAYLGSCAEVPRRQPPPELLAAGGRPSGTRRRRRR